jgi:hypothetical protein
MILTNVFAVTITAPSGPGMVVTAAVIPNVYAIDYNWVDMVVRLFILGNPNPLQFALTAASTVVTNVPAKTVVIA